MKTLDAVLKTLLFPMMLAGLFLIGHALALSPSAFAAGGENLGHVSRIQGAAFAQRGQNLERLALNSPVKREDTLKTAMDSRLELTMLDETKLTLGAGTEFVLERYDLGRQQGAGAVLLKLTKGAFRVATGELSALRGGPFEVGTPLGTIGIRGTDYWGGYLGTDEINVLLISGKGVYIKNDGGTTEILKPLEGVTIRSATAPPPAPTLWSPEKRDRAFKTVAFD
ncbi:MAG: FecR family protein [Humidesulfovibrio sp.]|uniref:FecR family protein n=1 Tax=Humidesulfovibrio sp. TaxID=2910988 RepID=UPI0027EFBDDA|nr:FecR family protein [Humidesulfovibrio sp.]MDQ7835125.1 FecR family protein [Humidesulfovibrio sp.]